MAERCTWSDLPVIECACGRPTCGPRPPTTDERADAIVTRLARGEARTTRRPAGTTPLNLDGLIGDISTPKDPRHNGGQTK